MQDVLIPCNSKTPCDVGRTYQTSYDSQTEMRFRVYEGEAEKTTSNKFLGEFILRDLERKRKGGVTVEATFYVNSSGIVEVRASNAARGEPDFWCWCVCVCVIVCVCV